jgi:hypothetical protein
MIYSMFFFTWYGMKKSYIIYPSIINI